MNKLFFQAVMGLAIVMKPDDGGDGKGGGGSSGGDGKGGGAGSGGDAGGGTADLAKLVSSLTESNKQLLERIGKLEAGSGKGGSNPPESKDDGDLATAARKAREEREKSASSQREIEAAIAFNMGSKNFLTENASLLPRGIEGIFAAAEKEVYETAKDKADAIKVGVMIEYFGQQANYDLLTQSQKNSLDEFKKLTKDLKQDRAQAIWETVFEPTIENAKRVLRAKQLTNGTRSPDTQEAQHTKKMFEHSTKAYLKK